MLTLFNKPYGTLCQFTRDGNRPTLAEFIGIPDIYPAGRLDVDSEGLVLLTADGGLQTRLAHPSYKVAKTYWVQVEGVPEEAMLTQLAAGVNLGEFVTRPATVEVIAEPANLGPSPHPSGSARRFPRRGLR